MDIEDIIARSRAPGQLVERRQFTLSQSKAIEKLREYSLRDPQQYILELIQAAVYAEATYVAVDVSHEELLVAWSGGTAYTSSQLVSIFDYLFADQIDESSRHLRQLAVGLNTLMQRSPRQIIIESGDGSLAGTARMELGPSGGGVLGSPAEPLHGTFLLVRYPQRWLPRFQGSTFHPEEDLIERFCTFMPVPVLLNSRLPFGASGGLRLSGQMRFDSHRSGAMQLSPQRGFQIVMGGVRICTLPLDEIQPPETWKLGLRGVIIDDTLRKTADHSNIVQDHRYAGLLHALYPAAVALMSEHDPSYRAPALPALVVPDESAPASGPPEIVAEPLPRELGQLHPRPTLPLAVLSALPAGAPVFRVHPDNVDALRSLADPQQLPWPVLVLRDGQARTLEDAHGVRTAPLAGPTDVGFVRRALERRSRSHQLSLPCRGGTLQLSLRLAGEAVGWGLPDGAPLLVAAGQQTLWCGQLPLAIPDLSAALLLDEDARLDVDAAVLSDIADTARAALGDLLARTAEDSAGAAFRCAALAAGLTPMFVDRSGGPRLDVALPTGWPVALRRLSLGGVTVDALLHAINHNTTVPIASAAQREALAALEVRLGHGCLAAPEDDRRPIVLIEQHQEAWALAHASEPVRGPRLWVRPSLSAAGSVVGSSGPAALAGRAPLLALLAGHDARGWEHLAAASGWTPQRCQDLGRLAMLELELALRVDAPVLRDGSGQRHPLAALSSRTVAPVAGPVGTPDSTLLLRCSQLQRIDAAALGFTLAFDDAPAIWASLPVPEAPGWLARVPVTAPGMRGWLGLRQPFDPTGGIFAHAQAVIYTLPQGRDEPPCHGQLTLDVGPPSTAHAEAVRLARRRLYQDLRAMRHPDAKRYLGAQADAARHRAAHDSPPLEAMRQRLDAALPPGLRGRFVLDVYVPAEQWVRFRGLLQEELESSRRWQLLTLALRHSSDVTADTLELAPYRSPLEALAAIPAVRGDRPVTAMVSRARERSRFDDRGVSSAGTPGAAPIELAGRTRSGGPFLQLNDDHPLVAAALMRSDAAAIELLLIEAARLLCRSFAELSPAQLILILTSQRLAAT